MAAGARRVTQGDAPGLGYFLAPTLLVDVPVDAPVMQEEPFGPVACAVAFDRLDEAIALANASPYGLAGYLFTDSARAIHAVSQRLEVGSLAVNGLGHRDALRWGQGQRLRQRVRYRGDGSLPRQQVHALRGLTAKGDRV
jgi:acyl-CoA reductase-like NAD-dependent aldehyde dehydrogenase